MSSAPIHVRYTNWRGETSTRRLLLGEVRFGSTEWHPKPTWLISAFDLDHPSQIWKEFDLAKCDFTRAEPLDHPKVKALAEAAEKTLNPEGTSIVYRQLVKQNLRIALAALRKKK